MKEPRDHGPVERALALVGTLIGFGNFLFISCSGRPLAAPLAMVASRATSTILGEHGRYTTVSREVYWLNVVHGRSLIGSIPMGLLCLMWLGFIREDDDHSSPIGRKDI